MRGRYIERKRLRSRPVVLQTLEPRRLFSTITVTGTGDTIAVDGVVTLREAITAANTNMPSGDANAGEPTGTAVDRIEFNIPGAGVHVIAPTSELPEVTDAVVIDGYTQPGAKANSLAVGSDAIIQIEIDGSGSGSPNGLSISEILSEVRGLSVVGFTDGGIGLGYGIKVDTSFVVVAGNFVGLHADGTTVGANDTGIMVAGRENRVGGTAPADRNIVSGNFVGIDVTLAGPFSGPNVVLGNYVGTDRSGSLAKPNAQGITERGGSRIGGPGIGEGNVISGNAATGVSVTDEASDTMIRGNIIGLAADGVSPLGNGDDGIDVLAKTFNVTVGGTLPGEGNIISANESAGVFVRRIFTTNISVRGNSIFANGGLGIDQVAAGIADGVTPNDANDADAIPNFPVLASAVAGSSGLTVSGVINSKTNIPLMIDVYVSDAADPSGYGEGQMFLGSIPVALGFSGNNATFSATFPATIAAGKFITATATNVSTDPNNDTSEFSKAVLVQGPPAPPPVPATLAINDVSANEGNSGTKSFTFTITRSGSTTGSSTVKYATSNGSAGSGDYDSKTGTVSFGPGETSKTINITVKGDTKVEGDENFNVNLSNATGATISDNKGVGTIKNDDGSSPPPAAERKLYIDLTKDTKEGNSGTKSITFLVRLDQAASSTVKVNYATSNGSAGSGDYNSASGTLTFSAGQTEKTITITVKGDTKKESDENFFVKLSNAVNAKIGDGTAVGIIRNDD